MPDVLDDHELDSLLKDLPEWSREGDAITRSVQASSFPVAIELVRSVAQAAETAQHHPDIDIRYTTVTFRLSTHSAGGITRKDIELAAEIDKLAATA